jgi:hypothetical protein
MLFHTLESLSAAKDIPSAISSKSIVEHYLTHAETYQAEVGPMLNEQMIYWHF